MIENLLLCVGAQKAGTTWLHTQLKSHPQIAFSHVKEVHYFDTIHLNSLLLTTRKVNQLERILKHNRHGLEKYFADLSCGRPVNKGIQQLLSPVDDNWYMRLLSQNKKKYSADFSPEYALLPNAGFENINRVCKNKKIIFIMRDPISRAKSAMRYFFETQGKDIAEESTEQLIKLASASFIINMSSYNITLEKLEQLFKPEDLLFLFYEDIMQNKQGAINQVTDFLDIAKVIPSEEQLERRVNVTNDFEFPAEINEILKTKLANTYTVLSSMFSKLPESWNKN